MMYRWDFAGTIGWMMVVGMAIIAATVMGSIWLIVHRPGSTGSVNATPMGILGARFAKGEITREQYEEAKRILA